LARSFSTRLVSVLDGFGERNFAFRAEQWFLRQAVEVAGDTFFFVHGCRVSLHRRIALGSRKDDERDLVLT
jgi:hypothetical protein